MPTDEIEERAKYILLEHLGCEPEAIMPEVTLAKLGADSLDRYELVLYVEEQFRCEVSDEEAESVDTFQDFVNLIQVRTSA